MFRESLGKSQILCASSPLPAREVDEAEEDNVQVEAVAFGRGPVHHDQLAAEDGFVRSALN